MVRDALRGYLELAGGLTEVTAARARAAARALAEQSGVTGEQVSALVEELVDTSRRNRESLMLVVRHEVEQAVRLLGVGAAGDVDALAQRVRRLEDRLRDLQRGGASTSTAATPMAKKSAPAAKKSAPKKSTAKKSTAKKSTAKKRPS
jgi:polyhydroxyalkanoate synthesis regulator phasin